MTQLQLSALQSREPIDEFVEAMARAICDADKYAPAPDAPVLIGMRTARAWEARVDMARAAIALARARLLGERPMARHVRYVTDGRRHLVCVPYSVEGLHGMAVDLGIARCWFHAGRLAHYDVPKRRMAEIADRCEMVSSRELVRIITPGTRRG